MQDLPSNWLSYLASVDFLNRNSGNYDCTEKLHQFVNEIESNIKKANFYVLSQ